MSPEQGRGTDDPAIRHAVEELQGTIRERYPSAAFDVSEGDDPEGVYLTATIDTDDLTTILETVSEPLFAIQVEQGLPLYLVPTRPADRVLKDLASRRARRRGTSRVGLDELYTRP